MCNIARKVYFVNSKGLECGKMDTEFITITNIKNDTDYSFTIEKDNEEKEIGKVVIFKIKNKYYLGYYIENKYRNMTILKKVFNHVFKVFNNKNLNCIYLSSDNISDYIFTSFGFELLKIDGPNIHVIKKKNTY